MSAIPFPLKVFKIEIPDKCMLYASGMPVHSLFSVLQETMEHRMLQISLQLCSTVKLTLLEGVNQPWADHPAYLGHVKQLGMPVEQV